MLRYYASHRLILTPCKNVKLSRCFRNFGIHRLCVASRKFPLYSSVPKNSYTSYLIIQHTARKRQSEDPEIVKSITTSLRHSNQMSTFNETFIRSTDFYIYICMYIIEKWKYNMEYYIHITCHVFFFFIEEKLKLAEESTIKGILSVVPRHRFRSLWTVRER